MTIKPSEPEPPPDAMRQARPVLVVLAGLTLTSDVWMFIWAGQLRSLILAVFGLICLPMSLVLVYGTALACQRFDAAGAERILQQRQRGRHSWPSHTPHQPVRHQPSERQRAHVGG